MTPTQKRQLHAALLAVKADVLAGRAAKSSGICWLIELALRAAQLTSYEACDCGQAMLDLAKAWPEHSGRHVYPVRDANCEIPRVAFEHAHVTGTMWTGEYGDARRRLLDWLIDQTRTQGETS